MTLHPKGSAASKLDQANLRIRLADIIDQAIAMLDALDGDADFEPETDLDIAATSLQGVNRVPTKRVTMRKAS